VSAKSKGDTLPEKRLNEKRASYKRSLTVKPQSEERTYIQRGCSKKPTYERWKWLPQWGDTREERNGKKHAGTSKTKLGNVGGRSGLVVGKEARPEGTEGVEAWTCGTYGSEKRTPLKKTKKRKNAREAPKSEKNGPLSIAVLEKNVEGGGASNRTGQ